MKQYYGGNSMVLKLWKFYKQGKLNRWRIALIKDYMKSRIAGVYCE